MVADLEKVDKNEIHDLRSEVLSLARELDRLPSGDYLILISKPEIKGVPWKADILRTDRVKYLNLFR